MNKDGEEKEKNESEII